MKKLVFVLFVLTVLCFQVSAADLVKKAWIEKGTNGFFQMVVELDEAMKEGLVGNKILFRLTVFGKDGDDTIPGGREH